MSSVQYVVSSVQYVVCSVQCAVYGGPAPDMENVPSKPSAARVIFFGSGKFLV